MEERTIQEYLHFDEKDPNEIEKEIKEIQHSKSLEEQSDEIEKEIQEQRNKKRIKEIEKIKKQMTLEELDRIKKELMNKERKSQKPTMYIPVIEDKDFAGILLMESVNDPMYSHSKLHNVDVWKKKINKTTWNGVGKAIIKNITPRRMSELYWHYNERKQWDSFYTVIDDIEVLPNNNIVSRTATWVPKMFTQRDYVHVREVIETDDVCIGVYLPAEHDLVPVGMNGFIRGYVNFSGYVFRRQGNDCHCSLMTQTDISFPLPDFLIDKFIAIAVKIYINEMKKASEKFGKKPYKKKNK